MGGLFLLFAVVGAFWLGLNTGNDVGVADGKRKFVADHTETPYCKSAEIVGKTYERCWKLVEITETKP